ncbi:MAG: hypothetical protein LBD03_03265 [Methanobrevibacter sp.]|jgi:DNA-directed RNA polymerase subunit RPC12/RpoP|nr:hypothetical protein [Candidatus Methanovirga procula]
MEPTNHSTDELIVNCSNCGKPISKEQSIQIKHDPFCENCAVKVLLNHPGNDSQNPNIGNYKTEIRNNEPLTKNEFEDEKDQSNAPYIENFETMNKETLENKNKKPLENKNEQSEIEKKYERYLDDLYYDEKTERNKKIKRNKRYEPYSLKDQLLSYERDHGSISSIPMPKSNLKNPDKSLTFEKKDNENYNNRNNNNNNNNNKLNKQKNNIMSEYNHNKAHNAHNYTLNNDSKENKYYIKTESNPFPNLLTTNKPVNSDINNNDTYIETYINEKIPGRNINKIKPKVNPTDIRNNRNNNQLNNTNRKSSNKDQNYIKNEKRKIENKVMNKKS